jgi:Spy/CpxP family protein refolding chaperone
MKAQLRIVSALVVCGLIAFAGLAGAAEKSDSKGDRKGGGVQERMEAMTKDLNLTADQKPKVQALLEEEAKAMRGMRDEMQNLSQDQRREKMMERRKAIDAKMEKILKPEQYQKWLKNRQNRPETPGAAGQGQKKGEGKSKGKKNKQ